MQGMSMKVHSGASRGILQIEAWLNQWQQWSLAQNRNKNCFYFVLVILQNNIGVLGGLNINMDKLRLF